MPDDLAMNSTHFLNIDLDIESETDIAPLVQELSQKLIEMTYHNCEGIYRASFESSESEIENIVAAYISAIRGLNFKSRCLWDGCRKREFNIGFQAENRPRSYEKSISSRSLSAIASVGGQIGITIYAPESNFI